LLPELQLADPKARLSRQDAGSFRKSGQWLCLIEFLVNRLYTGSGVC
jgi:hypothetical protein